MPSLRRRQKSLLFLFIAMKRVSLGKTVPLEKISIASHFSKVYPCTQDDEVFCPDDLGDLRWIYTFQPFSGSHTHHIFCWTIFTAVVTLCGVKTSVSRFLEYCWPRVLSCCLATCVMATHNVIHARRPVRRVVSLRWDRIEGLYVHDKSTCNIPSLVADRPAINLIPKSVVTYDSQRPFQFCTRRNVRKERMPAG